MKISLQISRSTLGLVFLTSLCILLEITRIKLRGDMKYSFLIWNLFLAWIPLFFALVARRFAQNNSHKLLIISNLTTWLLFFPNAPYIITDLLHLQGYSQNILWFDSLLIFIFAMVGLFVGLYSLDIAHQVFEQLFGKIKAWLMVFVSIFLSGFGVYLGRYSRWNSWDLFQHPFRLLRDIFHQLQNPMAIKLTLTFSVVMLGFYVAFLIFSQPKKYEFIENAS
jgi:uncharacterized membrane protein